MADDAFKLPGSSYTEVAKIIRAYGHAPDDAVPKDITDRAGIDPTIVSRNNGFLLSVGVISGGKKKTLTPTGRALAQAIDHEIEDQIAAAWRTLLAENEFFKKIMSAVTIRGGMDASSLRSHVAYTAGAPKTPASMTGAGSCVDVLITAGLLKEVDGGRLVSVQPVASGTEQPQPATESAAADSWGGALGRSYKAEPSVFRTLSTARYWNTSVPASSQVSMQVHLRIDCKPEDLDSLAPKLKALLIEMNKPDTGPDNTPEVQE